jgi:hypothetical protein
MITPTQLLYENPDIHKSDVLMLSSYQYGLFINAEMCLGDMNAGIYIKLFRRLWSVILVGCSRFLLILQVIFEDL